MDTLTKKTRSEHGVARFRATVSLDADEVDIIVWALEAYLAKSYGQPLDGFTRRLHDDFVRVYRTTDSQEPGIKPQGVYDQSDVDRVAQGFRSAGYILDDPRGVEVFRGSLDEVMAYVHQNHPFSWHNALAYQGYRLRAI